MVVIEQVRIDIKLAKHIKVSLGLCAEPLTVTTYHNITLNQNIEFKCGCRTAGFESQKRTAHRTFGPSETRTNN